MDLPASAAWRHLDARTGFEVLFPRAEPEGVRFEGCSTAVEDGVAWRVRYDIVLGAGWVTRSAHVVSLSASERREVRLEADGSRGWRVDGRPAPELAGCVDVDLEASACTNALPVNRLGLAVGDRADAPAVYVRAPAPTSGESAVQRLEQSYARLPDDGERRRYDYAAPRFDYAAVLAYDESGLVLDYPGLAVRVA